jgi:murein L,D-transpeptidase YcbB/YkuD
MLRISAATCAVIAWLYVSAAAAQAPDQAAARLAANAQAPASDSLKRIIEEGDSTYLDWTSASADREHITQLYAANDYRLLWSDGEKPTTAAILLLQELRNAGERGLDPEDYPGNRLAYLLIDLIDAPHSGIEQWAVFDAGLSLAAMRFLTDLHFGRIDPASVGHDLSIGRIKLDIPTTVAHMSKAVDMTVAVDALEPQFSHYVLLKKQLSLYRALADQDGLNDLPPLPAKSLKPGDAYVGAGRLQQLLVAFGDAPPPGQNPSAPDSLSPELVLALKHFQGRHGEKPDGILGAATYAELTRPSSSTSRNSDCLRSSRPATPRRTCARWM